MKDTVMLMRMANFWQDDAGFVVSAELALVGTIGILSTVVGLNRVAISMNAELNDLSNAIGALNQSFSTTGFQCSSRMMTSGASGSQFIDGQDVCDLGSIQVSSQSLGAGETASLVGF